MAVKKCEAGKSHLKKRLVPVCGKVYMVFFCSRCETAKSYFRYVYPKLKLNGFKNAHSEEKKTNENAEVANLMGALIWA